MKLRQKSFKHCAQSMATTSAEKCEKPQTNTTHKTRKKEKGKSKCCKIENNLKVFIYLDAITSSPSKLMDFLNSKTSENITGWLTIQ